MHYDSFTPNSVLIVHHFQDKSNPGQDLIRRALRQPVEEDPISTKSLARMRSWIDDCVENHEVCCITNDHFMPSRLLDLRDGIVLRHYTGPPVSYVALSHCWGPHIPEKPMLVTDSSTITQRVRDIDMSSYDHLLQRPLSLAVLIWSSTQSSGNLSRRSESHSGTGL